MRHVFLSPHFDDAVGSCGGTISRLCRAGEDVVVHTIFAGRPSLPYSAFARRLHAAWRSGDSPVDVRRAEDARACRTLGCRAEYSGWLDAIYRRQRLHASDESPPDDWLYPDRVALFGRVAARERRLPAQIARQILAGILVRNPRLLAAEGARVRTPGDVTSLARTRFYAPLGVGHHVDHVLAFRAGRVLQARGADVTFYQDFFYTDWSCPHLAGLRRRARATPFTAADLARKLQAFLCYRSQIPTLFGSAARATRYFLAANQASERRSSYREIFWQVAPQEALRARIEAGRAD